MSRYTRDEILNIALDMADLPTVNASDRPAGTILPTAKSILWLQNALDLFHAKFPWAGTIKTASISVTAGNPLIPLPADFIHDVRDGLILNKQGENKRLLRTDYQTLLDYELSYQSNPQAPFLYTVADPNLRITPVPDLAYTGVLHYYALPAALGANDIPTFPEQWCLIEYVRLRALEHVRVLPPMTAMTYANECVADLQRAGLGREPERSEIPLDRLKVRAMGPQPNWGWMGEAIR